MRHQLQGPSLGASPTQMQQLMERWPPDKPVPVNPGEQRYASIDLNETGPLARMNRFVPWRSNSHLIEDGVDPLFVQQQVGHSWASTTAVYTTIGADAKNRMLKAVLARVFDAERSDRTDGGARAGQERR